MEASLTTLKPRRQEPPTRPEARWMLLIHQIPPSPAYLRVKIGRQLARIGAVAIKNSVYTLPHDDETQEDFQWVLREIVKGGGDASIIEARFIEGLSDAQVIGLFQGDHLRVGEAFDEPRLDDGGVAAALHDLAEDPLQVLLRLGVVRQGVVGVLDRPDR